MNQDQEHLKLLSIFHYVVAGITALWSCFPFIHFFVGLAITLGWFEDAPPEALIVGAFFMVFAGVFILTGWGLATLMLLAGRNLARRKRYTFCVVVAAVECIFMPFGTVLGVFTIIVLVRESVKLLFDGTGAATAARPDSEGT